MGQYKKEEKRKAVFHKFTKIIGLHHFELFPTAYGYFLHFFSPPENPQKILQKLARDAGDFVYQKGDYYGDFAVQAVHRKWKDENLLALLEKYAPKQAPSITGILEACKKKSSPYLKAKLSEELLNLGQKISKKNKGKEASVFYTYAILFDPANTQAHLLLGEYFHHLSPKDERQEYHFQQVLKRLPKHIKALYFLGKLYFQWGNWGEALELWERFTKIKRDDARAYTYLGISQYEMGELAEAKESLLQALKLDSEYLPLYMPLARCYLKERNYDRARVMLRLLIERDPKSSEAHFLLAQCYLMLRQSKKAKKALKRALKFDPDHMEAYRMLGELYMKLGDERKGRKIQIKYKAWKDIVDKHGGLKVDEDAEIPDFEYSSGDWDIEEIKIEDTCTEDDFDDDYY